MPEKNVYISHFTGAEIDEALAKTKSNENNIIALENRLTTLEDAVKGAIKLKDILISKENFSLNSTNLSGYSVLNGSYAKINKISGDTITCKNLFDISKITGMSNTYGTNYNSYFTKVDDNTIKNMAGVRGSGTYYTGNEIYFKAGTYAISLTATNEDDGNMNVIAGVFDKENVKYIQWDGWKAVPQGQSVRLTGTITIQESKIYYFSFQADSIGSRWQPLQIYFTDVQYEIGDTVTSYTPYFSGLKNAQISGIKSTVYNLLPFPYVDGMRKTHYGITYTVNNDGSVLVDGTCTAPAGAFSIFTLTNSKLNYFSDDELFVISGAPQGSTKDTYFYYNVTTGHKFAYGTPAVQLQNKYGKYDIRVASGVTVNNALFKPMLIKASDFNETPPYISQTLNSETMFQQPIELAKWDYFENGKLIKRTEMLTFDGTEAWQQNWSGDGSYFWFSLNLEKLSTVNMFTINNKFDKNINLPVLGNYINIPKEIAELYPSIETWKIYLQNLAASNSPLVIAYEIEDKEEIGLFFNNKIQVWEENTIQIISVDENGYNSFDYMLKPTLDTQFVVVIGGNE